jgi:hypothetical protein
MTKRRQLAIWTGVFAVLLAVFAAYLRPDLAYTLANQIWNCF